MIKTIYYSAHPEKTPASGYWDQALLADILSNNVFKNLDADDGALVVIPGAYQAGYIKEINTMLSAYEWVIVFITSDEEGKFPVEKLKHPNMKIWVQYPKQGRHDQYDKLPLGYTTNTRKNLIYTKKTLDVFYSGQRTHERRVMCSETLQKFKKTAKDVGNYFFYDTEGFSRGLEKDNYMATMSNAKVAPAPSGPISADSFRCYEALEAGAVPIADQISPAGDHDYFNYLFGSVPFATINDYKDMPGYIEDILKEWPQIALEVQSWWIKKKWDIAQKIANQVRDLANIEEGKTKETEAITVIIPVSPIKSHPSVEVLDETIKSIKHNLPTADILLTFDGVRKEQENMRPAYQEFMRRALFLCNTEWNAISIVFREHTHQVGMARVALEQVKTPVILYCEQDTPLVTDIPIEWDKLTLAILRNEANIIRLHFEGTIPKDHKHLMLGEPENNLLKTIQWSQRPHLAHTSFYKYMLRKNFSEKANCFIEDKIHGVVQQDYQEMGERGWDLWKLFIYYPDPRNIKRSLNNDGRAGGKKYDESQVF